MSLKQVSLLLDGKYCAPLLEKTLLIPDGQSSDTFSVKSFTSKMRYAETVTVVTLAT
jgi:hypothetical protein